jgi:structural maintenance of chromosomes protein 5
MARKAQVHEDNDSQQEDTPDVPKLNNGKLKRENARKARVVHDEDEDVTEQDAQQSEDAVAEENDVEEDVHENNQPDEQEDEEGMEGIEEEGSPKGHKRARINTDGDSISIKNDVEVKGKGRVMTLPRDEDGQVFPSCRHSTR